MGAPHTRGVAIIKYKRTGQRTKAKLLGDFPGLYVTRVINHMIPETEDTQLRVEWETPDTEEAAAKVLVYMTLEEAKSLHEHLGRWFDAPSARTRPRFRR